MYLHQILGDGPCLDIVLISLADPPEEVDRVGVAQIPIQRFQNIAFGLEDLRLGVGGIGAVEEVGSRRGNDLLHLRGNEHARNPNELQLDEGDNAGGKETIYDVNAEEKCFREKTESRVNLNKPVGQNAPHLPREIFLHLHIVRIRHGRFLLGLE